MKKNILLIIALITMLACKNKPEAQETHTGYIITGTVKGVNNGTIKLNEEGVQDRSKIKTINSTEIVNGTFKFKGNVEHPDMVSVIVNDKYNGRFIIENSNITLDIDVTDRNERNTYFKPIVKGSKSHDLYTEMEEKSIAALNNPKFKKIDTLRALFDKAKQSKNQKDMDIALAAQKELMPLIEEQAKERVKVKYNFVKQNPSSPVAVHVLGYQYSEGRMNDAQLKEYYNLFTGDARKTNFFKSYITKVYKDNFENIGVGNTAPDFTLKNLENTNITLSKVNAKYKLVDFWASWCVPCRASFPHLKELRKKYQKDGFEIIGIGTADVEEKWKKAIEEDQTPWLHVFDVAPVVKGRASYGPVAKAYGVPHLPTTLLLDANNTIVLRNPTKEELDTKLKDVFKH